MAQGVVVEMVMHITSTHPCHSSNIDYPFFVTSSFFGIYQHVCNPQISNQTALQPKSLSFTYLSVIICPSDPALFLALGAVFPRGVVGAPRRWDAFIRLSLRTPCSHQCPKPLLKSTHNAVLCSWRFSEICWDKSRRMFLCTGLNSGLIGAPLMIWKQQNTSQITSLSWRRFHKYGFNEVMESLLFFLQSAGISSVGSAKPLAPTATGSVVSQWPGIHLMTLLHLSGFIGFLVCKGQFAF